jgi:hypothetical protein
MLEAIKEVIKDDKLGTFKFLFSSIVKIIVQLPSGKDLYVAIPT